MQKTGLPKFRRIKDAIDKERAISREEQNGNKTPRGVAT